VTVVARYLPPTRYAVYCSCVYRKGGGLELIWWFYDEIKDTLHVFFSIIFYERRENEKMKLRANSV
jgi:hypothetical protein